MENKIKNIILLFILLPLIYLGFFLKISFIAGSHRFFFSGVNFFVSIIGVFAQSFFSAGIISFFLLYKFSSGITFGLPTLIATFCWSLNTRRSQLAKANDFIARFLIPLCCMLIFILHPIGRQAYLYSFYWFIPGVIYLMQRVGKCQSIFYYSLSVTFVSHAVGSIIWLFKIPMTAYDWFDLIPVVFLERFVFTLGMVVTYLAVQKLIYYLNYLFKERNGLTKISSYLCLK